MVFLTIGNVILLLLALQLFPAYGGFSRQIIFIKPDEDSDGYFIIIDELAEKSQKYNIDWFLHSRGDLKLLPDEDSFKFTVPSYITNDEISLKVTFLENINEFKEEEGYFFPDHYHKDDTREDIQTSACIATYSGSESPIMGTVLYPKNNSDISQSFPEITTKNSGLKEIGNNDYLFYNTEKLSIDFSNPEISFNGQIFFLRRNSSYTNLLEFFFLQNVESLEFKNKKYFSSSYPITNILATYANNSQISGSIKVFEKKKTEISIYCPFSVEMVKIDGKNITDYSKSGLKLTFSIRDDCSFVISSTNNYTNLEYDPLRDSVPIRVKPKKSEFEFDKDLIEDLEYPYTLFNQTELKNLRNKIQDPGKDWKGWYDSYTSGVGDIEGPDDYDSETHHYYIYKLALKFVIDGGIEYLDKIKDFLDEMGKVDHYSQDLRRAYAVQAYSTVLDLVYNNLTKSERNKFSNYLYDQASPLMLMDLYPENNHRVVDAGALGMAGLVLKNKSMVNTAIDTIFTYYYTLNPGDGGSYEGYSYNSFAMDEFMQFAVSLKRLGAYNLFTDPQILATFDFMSETLGPLSMPSLYEDCTFSSRLQEVLIIAAANLNDTYPDKAKNYQFIWEQRQNNSLYEPLSDHYFSYLNGGSSSFNRIMCYNINDSITAEPFSSRKEIWKESGMAFLRSNDKPNGLFLSFSCKDYYQSHVHYDENSFEIWAYGAYIINNPGYPGFGVRHHDYTIETEASNTLLISGSGQRQEKADGLIASISSPYFSMVIGQAEKIYDDLGSFEYFPELYLLLIFNFILIGLACILFIQITKTDDSLTENDDDDERAEHEDLFRERITSKSSLIKMSFLSPNRTIDYVYYQDRFKDDANFLNKFIKILISGLMALFLLLLLLEMKTMVDYHLQYYEDKASGIFEFLKIAVVVILIVGPILAFLFSFAALKLYNRINRYLVYKALEGERTDLTKKNISFLSSISLIWQLPVLLFSFLLLYNTSAKSFQTAVHIASVGSGSIVSIYAEILFLLKEFIQNIGLILIFEIPFLLITLRLFSHGIHKNTNGRISKKKAWKISLTSIIFLLIIFFLLFITLVIVLKLGISLVSIESTIET